LIAYEADQLVNLGFKACRIMRASDLIEEQENDRGESYSRTTPISKS